VSARALIIVFLGTLACGCATIPEPSEYVRGPSETVEYYLSNFYRSRMARELYLSLAPAVRETLTYDEFALLRQREIAVPALGGEDAVARVQAGVLKGYRVNERHQVLYALQQVRYPYTRGRHNHYRLVRLHVVNDQSHWYVEPFVDERTSTVRLLPALKRDSLRTLYDDREAIAKIVADDIQAMGADAARPVEEVATDTEPLEIPDLARELEPIPGAEDEGDQQETLRARLNVGKLYYRAGQLDQAEDAFKRALELDPLNAAAKAYLERIRTTRQLREEKREMIELIERMLEAEKESEPE